MQRAGNFVFLRAWVLSIILMLSLLSCTFGGSNVHDTSSLPESSQKQRPASEQSISGKSANTTDGLVKRPVCAVKVLNQKRSLTLKMDKARMEGAISDKHYSPINV